MGCNIVFALKVYRVTTHAVSQMVLVFLSSAVPGRSEVLQVGVTGAGLDAVSACLPHGHSELIST